jgi:hypothetical protein
LSELLTLQEEKTRLTPDIEGWFSQTFSWVIFWKNLLLLFKGSILALLKG